MDSTLLWSLPEAILDDGVLCHSRPSSEYLQLLDMTGLCHGLPDCLGFPAFFMYGFITENLRFLETLEPCNILYDISSAGLFSNGRYGRDDTFALEGFYRGHSADPFHIVSMKRWIARCPGFGDIPEGVEYILSDQICQHNKPEHIFSIPENQHWLGLRPFFWAATDSSALQVLLSMGHDPNLTDSRGWTPLFYAAAYGNPDCFLRLLEAGARPDLKDRYLSSSFLVAAMENDHAYCAIKALEYLHSTTSCSSEVFQTLLRDGLHFVCGYPGIKQSLLLVETFLRLGADPNALSDHGESLGHRLKLQTHAQVLFDHGFGLLNMAGPMGKTCLHVAAKDSNVELVRFYVGKGPRLEGRDRLGRYVLHKILVTSWAYFSLSNLHDWYSTVRTILEHNVNVLLADHCRCACSMMGFTPAKALCMPIRCVFSAGSLPVEYLMLLEEKIGSLPAKQTLAELIRFSLFEKSELTHVCCRNDAPILDEEISEILDEDRLLIDLLEEEVEDVLERSLGRNPAEFWEEFLLESIVEKSKSTRTQNHYHGLYVGDLTCSDCWYKSLSAYSTFINGIYEKRVDDESTRILDNTWLQRRKSMIQRFRSAIEPLLDEVN